VRFELSRGQVPAGVSWAVIADRHAEGHGPVLAVDLSGDPLIFGVDLDLRLAVRPMTGGDLGDVVRWVSVPHVAKWWDDRRSPEQVAAQYGPALRGEEPTRLWILEVNGRSVGFCQDYRIADYPDYALLTAKPDAVGFDYAIGDPAWVGKGIGTALLWTYLRDLVAPAYPGVSTLFAAPDHRNIASLRVLAKLGFTEGVWFDEPADPGPAGTVIGCSLDVAKVIGSFGY
jgi:aminoglycoside 6'-N-acetyltransferase